MAYICKWKVHCSLVPEEWSGHKIRLLKGAWDVTVVLVGGSCMGWYMVKVQCILLYSSRHQGGLCLKGRFSWSQAARREPWSIL